MDISRISDIQISLHTTGISELGFNTILVVGTHTIGKGRVLTYTDTDQMIEDGFKDTDAIYKAVSAAFSQTPRPTQVKVGKWDGKESIADAMAAICNEDNDFYGIALADRTPDNVLALAAWTETHTKIFCLATNDANARDASLTSDIGAQLQAKNYFRSNYWWQSQAGNGEYVDVGIMARCFAIDPGGETWADKTVAGCTADALSETDYNTLTKKGYNTYERCRNISLTQNGKCAAGEWIDIIRFRDWLQEKMAVRILNLLVNADKIGYIDADITKIENVIKQTLQEGQDKGGIAPTEITSDGKTNLGWTVSVPLSSDVDANTKASRVLRGVKFTARLAGAIHIVHVQGGFTYENLIRSN